MRILAMIFTCMRLSDAVAMTNQKLSGSITFNVNWKKKMETKRTPSLCAILQESNALQHKLHVISLVPTGKLPYGGVTRNMHVYPVHDTCAQHDPPFQPYNTYDTITGFHNCTSVAPQLT